jgi:hypothetical protein
MGHVYAESVHSDNTGRLQVMHTHAHEAGLLPQDCALPGGVLHESTAKNTENTKTWRVLHKHTAKIDEALWAQNHTKSV